MFVVSLISYQALLEKVQLAVHRIRRFAQSVLMLARSTWGATLD